MKKNFIIPLLILLLVSCSTTRYDNYEYNHYFQSSEPYISVDEERDAARYIARKIARQFRRSDYRTLAVLNFTDEYGDPLNRGIYFADRVAYELSGYRNPVVIKRQNLYDIIRERELRHRNLIREKGYMIERLVHADYILTGRIIRTEWNEEIISVRCFETGTGRVIYAATVNIERRIYNGTRRRRPYPYYPRDRYDDRPSEREDEDEKEDQIKKPSKSDDGIEKVGKKDKENEKSSRSDKTRYKKKTEDEKDKNNDDNSGKDKKVLKKKSKIEESEETSSGKKKEVREKEETKKEKKPVLKK